MTSGGGDLERTFGRLLSLDVLEVGHRRVAGIGRRLRPPQGLQSLEVVDELKQILRREDGMSAAAQAASAPHEEGQISPLPRALAPMAAGSTPATVAIDPSRDNSPSTQKLSIASRVIAPVAAISPSATGRS